MLLWYVRPSLIPQQTAISVVMTLSARSATLLKWTPEVGPQHLFWELFTSASIPSSWSGSPPMSRTRSRTNQSCSRSRLAMSSLCLLSSSSLPFVVDYARSVLNFTVFFEWQVENIESLFFCNTLIYKLTIFSWI